MMYQKYVTDIIYYYFARLFAVHNGQMIIRTMQLTKIRIFDGFLTTVLRYNIIEM